MLRHSGAASEDRDGLLEDGRREDGAWRSGAGLAAKPRREERPGETGSVNRKVLIVDADRQAALYHKRMLGGRFEAETAADLAEALERLTRRGPFAAVVTELALPGGGGLELLRQVFEASPHTARIVLTRQVTLESALRAVNESRVFGFLEKSGDVARLAQTLEEAVAEFNRLSRRRPREAGGVLTDEEISFLMGRR